MNSYAKAWVIIIIKATNLVEIAQMLENIK